MEKKQQLCKEELEGQFRIASDGTWYHEGNPIKRIALVQLFATVLRKEEDGYVLRTPVEVVDVQVDDAPFVIVRMTDKKGASGERQIDLYTSIDQKISLKEAGQLYLENGKPYVKMDHGLSAKLNTATYYELMDKMSVQGNEAQIESYGVLQNFNIQTD